MGGVVSSMAGSMATSLACCAGQCACNACLCCVNSASRTSSLFTKGMYLLFISLASMLALVLRLYGSSLVYNLPFGYGKIGCIIPNATNIDPKQQLEAGVLNHIGANHIGAGVFNAPTPHSITASCLGATAVYRVSFSSFIWFLFMTLFTACAPSLHTGWFGSKAFSYIALIIATFFIPNDIFDDNGYASFARVASFLFLILQITITIDFAYEWNQGWANNAQEDEINGNTDIEDQGCCCGDEEGGMSKWQKYLLGISLFNYVLSLTGLTLCYIFYANIDGADNALNITFISLTVIWIIIVTAATLFDATNDDQDGGENRGNVLTASIVCLYAVYVLWTALSSNPESYSLKTNVSGALTNNATTSSSSSSVDGGQMFLGFVLTGVTLAWTTMSASNGLSKMSEGALNKKDQVGLHSDEDSETVPLMDQKELDSDEEDVGVPKTGKVRTKGDLKRESETTDESGTDSSLSASESRDIWKFHLIMMWGSIYLSMLVTNWGADTSLTGTKDHDAISATQRGTTAMWVKIVSQWITFALYLWTVIAPQIFPQYFYE